MPSRQMLISRLAAQQFSDLSEEESKILECCGVGKDHGLDQGIKIDTSSYAKWPTSRLVRADLIRWLLTDSKASKLVHPFGLSIKGVKVEGSINLRWISVDRTLKICDSVLLDGIDLRSAELRHLDLSGSLVSKFNGEGLGICHGDLFLRRGFSTSQMVLLVGASIEGDLDCAGSTFKGTDGYALAADRSAIRGDVRLSGGFKAIGKVSFVGAKIAGSFICSGGSFENRTGRAISLDSARVDAGISLDDGFQAIGTVTMSEARLIGGVILSGGVIQIAGCVQKATSDESLLGVALDAVRVNISGDILFNKGFKTDGKVQMTGCCVDGDLVFKGAHFTGAQNDGLIARGAEIQHGFYWQEMHLTPRTVLDLTNASAAQLSDDEVSWPAKGNLAIRDFSYSMISEGPFSARERLKWLDRQFTGQPSRSHQVANSRKLFSLQPYEQLASIFRRTGHDTDAKTISFSKEEARRQLGEVSWHGALANWFLGRTIKHGYGVGRVLAAGAIMILLSWLIFSNGHAAGLILKSKEDKNVRGTMYPSFSPFVYSVDSFLPIVDLHQESYWLPDAEKSALLNGKRIAGGLFLRWYLWAHITIGWIVSTLAVVSLTGLIRRE